MNINETSKSLISCRYVRWYVIMNSNIRFKQTNL